MEFFCGVLKFQNYCVVVIRLFVELMIFCGTIAFSVRLAGKQCSTVTLSEFDEINCRARIGNTHYRSVRKFFL